VAHLGVQSVVDQEEDGGVVVELEVVNREAFSSFVLGFLDHAEVLEPRELREELITRLEAIAS
jgi:predicted DNA-binding transcriptional regulator YafY